MTVLKATENDSNNRERDTCSFIGLGVELIFAGAHVKLSISHDQVGEMQAEA